MIVSLITMVGALTCPDSRSGIDWRCRVPECVSIGWVRARQGKRAGSIACVLAVGLLEPFGSHHLSEASQTTRCPRLDRPLRALTDDPQIAAIPIALAGRGATRKLAQELGATLLDVDPVTAATRIAAEAP